MLAHWYSGKHDVTDYDTSGSEALMAALAKDDIGKFANMISNGFDQNTERGPRLLGLDSTKGGNAYTQRPDISSHER